jgi:hypothetical protein
MKRPAIVQGRTLQQRIRLVVEVSGGLVQNVYADRPTEVIVVDWDNIECGDPKPEDLRFDDGSGPRSIMSDARSRGARSRSWSFAS